MSRPIKIGIFTITPKTLALFTFSEEHLVGESKSSPEQILQKIKSDTQNKYEPQLFKYKTFAGDVYSDGFSIVPTPYRLVAIQAVGKISESSDGTHINLILRPGSGLNSLRTTSWLVIVSYLLIWIVLGGPWLSIIGITIIIAVHHYLMSQTKTKIMAYMTDNLGIRFSSAQS